MNSGLNLNLKGFLELLQSVIFIGSLGMGIMDFLGNFNACSVLLRNNNSKRVNWVVFNGCFEHF